MWNTGSRRKHHFGAVVAVELPFFMKNVLVKVRRTCVVATVTKTLKQVIVTVATT